MIRVSAARRHVGQAAGVTAVSGLAAVGIGVPVLGAALSCRYLIGVVPLAAAVPHNLTMAVFLTFAGLLVIGHDRRSGIGWTLCAIGASFAVLGLASVLSQLRDHHVPVGGVIPLRERRVLRGVSIALKDYGLAVLPLWFPLGRMPGRWWRASAGAVGIVYATYYGLFIWYLYQLPSPALPVEDAHPLWGAFGLPVICCPRVLSLGVSVWLIVRRRATAGRVGRQFAVLAVSYGVYWAVSITDLVGQARFMESPTWLDGPTAGLALFALVLAAAGGMARSDFGRVERLLRGALMALGIGMALIGSYQGLHSLIQQSGLHHAPAAVALATGLCGLALGRFAQLAWRAVDQIFYGRRAAPYAALRSLGARLRDHEDTDDIAWTVCGTVVDRLGLPSAELVAVTRVGERVLASVGVPEPATTSLPLHHGGEEVGVLRVGCRPGLNRLDDADREALTALADQIAPVVQAARLREELRASRERVVAAREEERRRLRRDLHDGMGPALAGMGLCLEAAEQCLDAGSPAAAIVAEAARQTGEILRDVRRLTDDLRPAELDDLGLAEAVRQLAARLAGPRAGFTTVDVGSLPELPAATEVAAYRIVAEALTNVVKHARARHAGLRLAARGRWLELEVADDGIGVGGGPGSPGPDLPGPRSGVGHASMAERAEEIGGFCEVVPNLGGGTVVRARLPLTMPRRQAATPPDNDSRLEVPSC